MDVKRQADLGLMFQEALRNYIGDQRYESWFAIGVRFVFTGNLLTVLVDTPFKVTWFENGYSHIFKNVAQQLFGVQITVKVALDEAAASALKASDPRYAQSNPQPSAPRSNYASLNPQSAQTLAQPQSFNAPAQDEQPAPQPKRKRGRPPKNPQQAPPQSIAAIPQSFPQYAPYSEDDVYDDPVLYAQVNGLPMPGQPAEYGQAPVEPEPDPNAVLEPVKRKRGRPPKNPQRQSAYSAPTPSYPNELPAASNAPNRLPPRADFRPAAPGPNSFLDDFAASADAAAYEKETFAARQGYPNLSDSERVSWAVGDFDDESVPTPAPAANAPTRAKRGRPKGSTNRRAPENDAPNLFDRADDQLPPVGPAAPANPVSARSQNTPLFDDEEENFSRDANGLTFVTRAKEPPRVRSASDRTIRYASLRTFVEGYSNRLARQMCDVAITEPGMFSPLFISGPTSVGKTHLLEGLCEAYLHVPNARPPLYMTSEQFTSAFIHSLRGGGSFRARFRDISLLALDDLHFLEGKLSTQTELLYVLDSLRGKRVQIAFTANRPLSELKLRGELASRIEGGAMCKIAPPERETLAGIFRQMALVRRVAVSDEVCRYVVSRFATHARQLSGALNRLLAAHLTTGRPVDLDLAKEFLADLAAANSRNIRLDDVERAVIEIFALDPDDLKSQSRAKKCADPRAVAMWIARKYTRAALAEIGDYFGGRKHSAVLSAQKKVDEWIKTAETIDAGGAEITVADAIERVERALGRPSA